MDTQNKVNYYQFAIAIGIGSLFGVISANAAPFQIGLLIDEMGFTQQSTGALVTIELIAVATTAIVVAPFMSKLSIGKVAIVGAAIAVTGQIATIFIVQYVSIVLIRIFTAFGLGLTYAAANAAGAKSDKPDKVFSYGITFSLILLAIFLVGLSRIIAIAGYQGLYISLAVLLLLVLPALRWLNVSSAGVPDESVQTKLPWLKLGLLLIVVIFFNLGTGAAWTFMERVGVQLGLNQEQIGTLIGLSVFAGIAGAISVSWLNGRVGRTFPLVAGLSMGGLSSYLIAAGPSVALFTIGAVTYWASYMFMYPYLIGLACRLDKSGRSSAAVAGTLMLSFAMGPLLASYIVSVYSFELLATFCLLNCIAAAFIVIPLTLPIDRNKLISGVKF